MLRIDPNPGTDMIIQAKEPGANTTRSVDLSLIFAKELGEAPEPYERLLFDAMRGDSAQFAREDGVEETWRIVQPLIDNRRLCSRTRSDRGGRIRWPNSLPDTPVGVSPGWGPRCRPRLAPASPT